MKFFIAFSAVVLTAAALPAPSAPVVIGADNLLLNASRTYEPRNAGLTGWATGTVGGANGARWIVSDAWALRDACNSAAPRTIEVRGRIDLTTLFTSSPGVVIHVGPYKTIIGGNSNAEIYGGSLRMVGQVHVIIQNIKFSNCISYAPGERPSGNGFISNQQPGAFGALDCIDIERSENVWVDHCELSDNPWNAATTPADRRRHNGLITVKNQATRITISNSILSNHNMNFLIGHDDSWASLDTGRLKVTIYLCWFQGTVQRNPMVRFGEVHVLNNLYTNIQSYGIGVHTNARIYGERNHFVNCPRAWGTPVINQPAGGQYFNYNNLLTNSGFDSGITGSQIGWNPNNHYNYSPMAAQNVEAHVRTYAGTW